MKEQGEEKFSIQVLWEGLEEWFIRGWEFALNREQKDNEKCWSRGTSTANYSAITQERLVNGTHNLLGDNNPNKTPEGRERLKERMKKIALEKIANGTHNFLKQTGDNNPSKKRVANGTHNFLGDNHPSKKRVANGTHYFQKKGMVSCLDIQEQRFVRIPREDYWKERGTRYFGPHSKEAKTFQPT